MDYDSQKPDMVFEFHHRSVAILQALGIIPRPKREAPPIVDVDDEDILPPPKRQKAAHGEDLMQSMQVRDDRHFIPAPSPNNNFDWNRRSWNNCGTE